MFGYNHDKINNYYCNSKNYVSQDKNANKNYMQRVETIIRLKL